MKIIGVLVVLLAVMGMLGAITATIIHMTELGTDLTTTTPSVVPYNVTVPNAFERLDSASNGTITLDADNYTLFASDALIQIEDNTSWTGTLTLDTRYEHDTYVGGAVGTLLLLIPLFLIAGLLFYVTRETHGR